MLEQRRPAPEHCGGPRWPERLALPAGPAPSVPRSASCVKPAARLVLRHRVRYTGWVRSVPATLVLATLAATVFVSPASGVTGELRTVYVLTTWNDQAPFTTAETERVAAETDAFFRTSSSGRFSMPGSVVGPVRLPRSVFLSCDATVVRNAAPPALFTGYERAVMITPHVDACQFHGEANPTEVYLNGYLSRSLAAHELGHTLGLAHASRWGCRGSRCTIDEYGNPFSVMGSGGGDFDAFEKSSLEWLTEPVRADVDSLHEIGPIEGPTPLPQALVVTTASSEFWFESRGVPTPSFHGESVQPAGVVAVAGPAAGGGWVFPRPNLLVQNPAGGVRYAFQAGESFVRRGVFAVSVESHEPERALLRFRWLDRTAPKRPAVRARATDRGRVRVTWDSARERGSGVKSYEVLLDGRAVQIVDAAPALNRWQVRIRAPRGAHRVGVAATDRAGNRGRVASATVRVR